MLRLLFSGGPVDFDGRFYQLRAAHAFPAPKPPPRIIIGGETPAGARLAARIGDAWTTFMGYWEGLESLLLTFPATLWLARAFTDRPREKAVAQALRIVDDNFGYNRLLGSHRQRFGVRTLAARGELAKLVAWYAQ